MALVDQNLSPLSPRQGNINPRLYALAESAAYGTVFHDITSGSNDVPAASGGVIGYSAGPGYDLTTGWGSLDVNAFVAAMAGAPVISSWSVSPTTVPLGQTVTVSYSVTDTSGAGLSRAELWRAPDSGGTPGLWSEIGSAQTLSGSGPVQITLTDAPTAGGSYWYGTHVFDGAGDEALEPSPTQVNVGALQAPSVSTGPATAITVNSATLTGTVNPNGLDTHFYFLYATKSTLSGASQTPSQDLGSGATASIISANIAGLSTGTTYYFRVVASNSSGTTNGSIVGFQAGNFATVTTTAATTVTGSGATISGTINPQGANGWWGFEWSTSPTMSPSNWTPCFLAGSPSSCPAVVANSTTQSFSETLTGLASSTTYYYRIGSYDSDNQNLQWGATLSFTTGPAPAVTTTAATTVTGSGATISGTINPQGANGWWGFEWSTSPTMSPSNWTPCFLAGSPSSCPAVVANSTTQSFSETLTGLASSTTYYYRIGSYDSDNQNLQWGATLSFTTGPAPAVTTTAAATVTGSGATISGTINPQGANGWWGFEWSTSPTMSPSNWTPCFLAGSPSSCPAVVANSTTQSFSETLTGLASSTTYYYRIGSYDSDNQNLQWGATLSFTTGPAPAVTTTAATTVTGSGATISGTINPQGANGWWGFEWSTSPTMSPSNWTPCFLAGSPSSCPAVVANSTTQSFSETLTGLASSTTYYYRIGSYDSDNQNLQWGATLSFTTGPAPAVTTTAATTVTGSGATISGTINPQGANGWWGFEWSTSPTMSPSNWTPCFLAGSPSSCPAVVANSTTQSFSETLTGLASSTTYYYRIGSYDSDNSSLRWGSVLSFTTTGLSTPTVSVTPSSSKITTAQSDQVTVTVSGGAGNPSPTGSVTLSSGTYTSAATTLSAASANINVPAGKLSVGSDTLTATYTPDSGSSSTYTIATGSAPVTVVQAIGSCTNPNPNPNPAAFGAPGDFNGDCRSDILWRNTSTGETDMWLMNGTGITSAASLGTIATNWTIAAAGDFNGDGKSDILWRNSSTGEVDIWLMNGTVITSAASLGTIATNWTIAAVGDFDGDGKSDILWRNTSTGEVDLWLMNGASITSGTNLGTISTTWTVVGAGDFNGDGKADILWRNTSTGEVDLWLMNGASITSGTNLGTVATNWTISGIGDFDGDGKSDILWRNTSTGEVDMWIMNGTGIASAANLATISTAWSIAGTGDFNGDGKADILWRNTSTGEVDIWLMNGTGITSAASLGTIATNWQIATLSP